MKKRRSDRPKKDILNELLTDKTKYIHNNGTGRWTYKMYAPDMSPLYYISDRQFRKLKGLLKVDKKGRYTLNLSLVRQQHGNTYIKKKYRENEKQSVQGV